MIVPPMWQGRFSRLNRREREAGAADSENTQICFTHRSAAEKVTGFAACPRGGSVRARRRCAGSVSMMRISRTS
jgi:hypothetical protein